MLQLEVGQSRFVVEQSLFEVEQHLELVQQDHHWRVLEALLCKLLPQIGVPWLSEVHQQCVEFQVEGVQLVQLVVLHQVVVLQRHVVLQALVAPPCLVVLLTCVVLQLVVVPFHPKVLQYAQWSVEVLLDKEEP